MNEITDEILNIARENYKKYFQEVVLEGIYLRDEPLQLITILEKKLEQTSVTELSKIILELKNEKENLIRENKILITGSGDIGELFLVEQRKNIRLIEALRWFCNRVDAGEVRSKRTYERFKELLDKYD